MSKDGSWSPRTVPRMGVLGLVLLVLAMGSVLVGCGSVGPRTIARDRLDYVTALSDSWKRQMLLNLVKVRYGEAPVFMDVASVIGAYSLEGEIAGIGEYALPGVYMSGDRIARMEASGRYSDRPTITYHPLSGDKFAKSLMASIPISGVLYLIESGYPADLILRVCVNMINGLANHYGGAATARAGSPAFRELMTAVREAQRSGGIGFRMKSTKGKSMVVMFTHRSTAAAREHLARLYRLLGLDGTKSEFRIGPGSFADHDTDIAILTRSMLQVMSDVASYIDVPESDLAERRIYTPHRTAEQERLFPAILNIRHSTSRPADAYVAVQYRDRWFWIDDRDYATKLHLTFLMLLFSLTEGGTAQPAPLVTIPAR